MCQARQIPVSLHKYVLGWCKVEKYLPYCSLLQASSPLVPGWMTGPPKLLLFADCAVGPLLTSSCTMQEQQFYIVGNECPPTFRSWSQLEKRAGCWGKLETGQVILYFTPPCLIDHMSNIILYYKGRGRCIHKLFLKVDQSSALSHQKWSLKHPVTVIINNIFLPNGDFIQ